MNDHKAMLANIYDAYFLDGDSDNNPTAAVRNFYEALPPNLGLEKVFIQILTLFPPDKDFIHPRVSTTGFLPFLDRTPSGEQKPVFSIAIRKARLQINLAHNDVPNNHRHREFLLDKVKLYGLPLIEMKQGWQVTENCVGYSSKEQVVSVNFVTGYNSYILVRFLAAYLEFFRFGDWEEK